MKYLNLHVHFLVFIEVRHPGPKHHLHVLTNLYEEGMGCYLSDYLKFFVVLASSGSMDLVLVNLLYELVLSPCLL